MTHFRCGTTGPNPGVHISHSNCNIPGPAPSSPQHTLSYPQTPESQGGKRSLEGAKEASEPQLAEVSPTWIHLLLVPREDVIAEEGCTGRCGGWPHWQCQFCTQLWQAPDTAAGEAPADEGAKATLARWCKRGREGGLYDYMVLNVSQGRTRTGQL